MGPDVKRVGGLLPHLSSYLVIKTALSWWAIPFSGMLLPPLWWDKTVLCHLQKLSRDLSAWWLISRLGCRRRKAPLWSESFGPDLYRYRSPDKDIKGEKNMTNNDFLGWIGRRLRKICSWQVGQKYTPICYYACLSIYIEKMVTWNIVNAGKTTVFCVK